ncbi:MAG: RagB/SusD family nutrient uptake outer membrane protein [Prevotella sp.]|nr:RagB/SusD family nutrient uptake outer membrane protein [Prevotella sp.]
MKRMKYYALCIINYALSSCLLFTACTLDEEPRDQIPEEEAYTNPTTLYQNTVAMLYTYIGGNADGQGLQGTCRGIYDLQTFGSDEAMVPTRGGDWYDGGIWQDLYRHSWGAGHEMLKNSWLYLYKVITLCNRSLKLLENYKIMLSDYQYDSYQAEVRALRAIYYWYLIDLFGNVPIITSTDVSMNEVQQSQRSQVFAFTVSELQKALPLLADYNSVHQGDYYGRVTRPVALFVLAKLMLNAEVYTGTPQWQACIDYCDLIEAQGFWLELNYERNFYVHNDDSNENIWTIVMDKDLYSNEMQYMFRSWHYRHAAAYGFGGENGACATKKVLEVSKFETPEQDRRLEKNYWTGVVTDRNNNIVTDRSGNPLEYHPVMVKIDLSGSKYVETAGARMKKYDIDKNALKDGKLMDNDIVLFRFADVLLMRAEAKLRAGQDGQDDYDCVRLRAGMPERPITLENLLDERLMELCWEGWRRQDMIRFHCYKSLYEGINPVDESDGHTCLFPIPGDIITLNPNIKQNKGY